MRRITISVEDSLAEQFDALIARGGYENRSEAFRDLLRQRIEHERISDNKVRHCVATLSYVYNHHERELASRMAELQHAHHELVISATHVHLDHDHCLETLMLRGPFKAVRSFADRLMAQSGVRHGSVNIVPTQASKAGHTHHHGRPTT